MLTALRTRASLSLATCPSTPEERHLFGEIRLAQRLAAHRRLDPPQHVAVAARGQHPDSRDADVAVAVVHRTGPVPAGEAAVAIAVASGHRAEAFETCRWIIDRIKETVPVWK
ncbi:MAG: molybdenum cofactor biosynthesis protein MoaE, partial [Gemmatimonadetes bacterium]|nr:molybdenum cofactor biosynthesis protein MoaE [Gemmatimonadota bacterium]